MRSPKPPKCYQNTRSGNEIAGSEAGTAETWWVVPYGESVTIARPPSGLLASRSARPPRFSGAPFAALGRLSQKIRSSDLWISAASAVFQGCIRCTWPQRLRIWPPNSEIWPFLASACNAHERVASFSALTPCHRRPSSCAACCPAAPHSSQACATSGIPAGHTLVRATVAKGDNLALSQNGASHSTVAKKNSPLSQKRVVWHCRKKEQFTVAKKNSDLTNEGASTSLAPIRCRIRYSKW